MTNSPSTPGTMNGPGSKTVQQQFIAPRTFLIIVIMITITIMIMIMIMIKIIKYAL